MPARLPRAPRSAFSRMLEALLDSLITIISTAMKICIKKALAIVLVIILFCLSVVENCNAQDSTKNTWSKIVLLHLGYPPGTNNWEYSHPLYNGTGGVQIIRETGSFKSGAVFIGQFELSKGYFGFSTGAGIFPVELKVDKKEESYKFNSFFLEIEGMFFPLKNSTRLVPFAKIGAGGVTSFGDLDNTALFVSFAGGLRTLFTKNLGMTLTLKGRYFTYDEIPLDENLTGDIKFTNFVFQLGFMYAL